MTQVTCLYIYSGKQFLLERECVVNLLDPAHVPGTCIASDIKVRVVEHAIVALNRNLIVPAAVVRVVSEWPCITTEGAVATAAGARPYEVGDVPIRAGFALELLCGCCTCGWCDGDASTEYECRDNGTQGCLDTSNWPHDQLPSLKWLKIF